MMAVLQNVKRRTKGNADYKGLTVNREVKRRRCKNKHDKSGVVDVLFVWVV